MPEFNPYDLQSRWKQAFRLVNIPGSGDTAVAVVNPDGSTISGGGGGGGNVNLIQVGGSPIALGQTTESASLPVTIASNQSAVPISGTVNQGTQGTIGSSWYVELTNGTNPIGTLANPLRVDPTGTTTQPVSVTNFPGTQPISGTVTANQGTAGVSPWPVSAAQSGTWNINNITGTISLPTGASTAANQTTANTTLSNIQTNQTNGTQVTTVSGNVTVVQPTGSNLHVDVDNFPATQPVSGTVTSNQGTPNSLANGWPVEITDGTNILGTSTHPVRIDPTGTTTQPVSGTVTANIGTTNGLALDATVSALEVSQGSTTSGQKGILGLGAVTTAAPAYTTAQTSPLSLTTAGQLRVDTSASSVTANGGSSNINGVHINLHESENQITTNTTTTIAAGTAYLSSIVITVITGGTTSTITVQDRQGTPLVLVNALATTTASTTPIVINFAQPILMTTGISVVTAGAVAATVNVWMSYWD